MRITANPHDTPKLQTPDTSHKRNLLFFACDRAPFHCCRHSHHFYRATINNAPTNTHTQTQTQTDNPPARENTYTARS